MLRHKPPLAISHRLAQALFLEMLTAMDWMMHMTRHLPVELRAALASHLSTPMVLILPTMLMPIATMTV